jgi:hypothetical protein
MRRGAGVREEEEREGGGRAPVSRGVKWRRGCVLGMTLTLAPKMAGFSSHGINAITPQILKLRPPATAY